MHSTTNKLKYCNQHGCHTYSHCQTGCRRRKCGLCNDDNSTCEMRFRFSLDNPTVVHWREQWHKRDRGDNAGMFGGMRTVEATNFQITFLIRKLLCTLKDKVLNCSSKRCLILKTFHICYAAVAARAKRHSNRPHYIHIYAEDWWSQEPSSRRASFGHLKKLLKINN